MQQIILNLPDSLVEHAKYFGEATSRDTEAVLADTLEMMWPAWKDLLSHKDYSPVESLSDEEVLDLADLKMDAGRNERQLQAHGKAAGLMPTEQFELLVLIHLYQIGMLRKSEGLAEVLRRGLRKPLPS
ncbi:MAG: hypothetical protein GY749_26065 [Desulfobacteraceae bacterium]|nr:hypothetical protein [Desulfobacteraceae bacterium]